jgi:flagellar biosynthetic protein FliQ
MTEQAVIDVGRDAMMLILMESAPLMLTALVIGLIIAVFQALTTIQEMTLTFVPKIFATFLALVLALPFMARLMIEFGQKIFDRVTALGVG